MKTGEKKRALSLGFRIICVFCVTLGILFTIAYFVLSRNVHTLLADYSVKLVQAMAKQGAETVEYELQAAQEEAAALAHSFTAPAGAEYKVSFPQTLSGTDILRMVYVSEDDTVTSDGRTCDVRERQDIRTAFQGKMAVYGPYFNEEGEFIICYSVPIMEDGEVAGVFSIERDGYRLCKIIENIKFADSGEAYIINEEGTDIAVSRLEHLDWVQTQYNGRQLLSEQEDPVTRSIVELEQNGLDGKSGVGTYYWEGSLCYVIYEPIQSTGWVLLAGLREEEIASMTQSVLFSIVSKGPVLGICLIIFFLLTGLIVFWIISNTRKVSEINEKLEIIANHDSLTGLLNRRFLEEKLPEKWKYPVQIPSQAAVFIMDIDDFKKYNDFYGHPQGDDCLRQIADIYRHAFDDYDGNVIRYGGEEFVAVLFAMEQDTALKIGKKICALVEAAGISDSVGGAVTVSVGICHIESTLTASLPECIQLADEALYQAKKNGKNRAILLELSQKSKEQPVKM